MATPFHYPTMSRHLYNIVVEIEGEVIRRVSKAETWMRIAAQGVVSGPRTGRVYKLPDGSYYQASAPGEPPTVKSGRLHDAMEVKSTITPGVETWEGGRGVFIEMKMENNRKANDGNDLIEYLEGGTSRMEPRPSRTLIIRKSWPYVQAEFNRNFFPKAAQRR